VSIGCLGWGSLIWNLDGLPIARWKGDGPALPIEFARQSKNGRLTLVLLDHGKRVPVLHGILRVPDLNVAISALSTREGCPKKRIGYWAASGATSQFLHAKAIASWAQNKHLDAVVWTALPAKFSGVDGRIPTVEEAISYFNTLQGDSRRIAEEYIRKAPAQVRTPYRKLFEQHLGWYPIEKAVCGQNIPPTS